MPTAPIDKSALASGLCDWPRRLEKEGALLESVLEAAPSRRVLDLGCGDGRHARHLAERGFEVVGIDASEPALDRAQQEPIPDGAQFILTDLGAVERSVRGHFGAALCLGNTLPHLLSPESVSRMLIGLRRRLLPGAPLLLQTLNYDRIFAADVRSLPLELLPFSDDKELLVIRLLKARADGIVLHTTAAARHQPGADPPLQLIQTHQAQLRGWKRAEIETLLEVARFSIREIWGDMGRAPYDPHSIEQIVVAV